MTPAGASSGAAPLPAGGDAVAAKAAALMSNAPFYSPNAISVHPAADAATDANAACRQLSNVFQ